jgi:ATP-dependent DNA helicase PIF1
MTQSTALKILRSGQSVFLTGEAGSGKTHTVNEYVKYLRAHGVSFAVTASTGIAATHVGGMTIHSWSGIGTAQSLTETEIRNIAKAAHVAKRIRKAQVLIIDEISMLDGRVLTLVETVCRVVRKSSVPFGGMQVVLVGDFFQLPPVTGYGQTAEYAFQSEAWERLVPTICYLEEQYRQDDQAFLAILSAIRENNFEEGHYEAIRGQLISLDEAPQDITKLYSHNAQVDVMNLSELKKLPGVEHVYVMEVRGKDNAAQALIRGCLSPQKLELRVGAVVMFTKNNPNAGYVNGTLGTVLSFDEETDYPIIKTKTGNIIQAVPADWTISEGDDELAKITQLPIRLAWAMTIHKSQGVSLDAAVMDLSKVFEYGQGYVALSRVRSLRGVHLLGINNKALQVHPQIRAVDQEFRHASKQAHGALDARNQELQEQMETNFIVIAGGKKRSTE